MSKSRREFYASQLSRKQLELAAIQADLETCQTKKQELKLNKDAEQLLREIDELEKTLSDLDVQSGEMTVKLPALDNTLRKIDFSEARRVASQLSDTFEAQDGGFALLLLQRTTQQMGHYCCDAMLSSIFGCEMDVTCQKYKSNPYKLNRVDFADKKTTVGTPTGFLEKISTPGGYSSSQDLEILNQAFRESFCNSLSSGDQILFQVKDWHSVMEPKSFLRWFVEDFWKPLLDQVKRYVFPRCGRIKIVAVLTSNCPISPDYLSEVTLCPLDSWNPHHMIDVPLPNWTIADVQKWLMEVQKLDRSESLSVAEEIDAESGGIPHIICSSLRERYSA
jgi:hypothetical protein